MKLHLLDRASHTDGSFTVNHNNYPHFLKIWHYHPEYELVLILKSSGTLFIGDSIEKFNIGDLVLIGKNLPHMWLNDEIYFDDSSDLEAEAIAIHFGESFLGEHFFQAPEMKLISKLFERAKFGVSFLDLDPNLVLKIRDLVKLETFNRTIGLLEILHDLAKHASFHKLCSSGYISSFQKKELKEVDKIHEYVFENFQKPISVKDLADLANMNPSSFSRFFKRTHRKTFTRYLNEVRIGYACKLLMENSGNITEVCYTSGFGSISNFNKQFRLIVKMSPSEYIQFHT